MIKTPITLVSKSPRRSQLLKEAGFNITIESMDIDESFPEELPALEVAEYIALKKAKACEGFAKEGTLVLTADTVVVFSNKIYEKPIDKEDAKRILRDLSGNKHTVVTGVAVNWNGKIHSFSDESDVYFQALNEEEIEYYLESCKPYDKAGSYGVQEWIGHCKIAKIDGSYTNIMGLPMQRVYQLLRELGVE